MDEYIFPTGREQKLVNICFELVLTAFDANCVKTIQRMTQEQRAEWVRSQLAGCGFPTSPCGASWGVLKPTPVGRTSGGPSILEPHRR